MDKKKLNVLELPRFVLKRILRTHFRRFNKKRDPWSSFIFLGLNLKGFLIPPEEEARATEVKSI